MLFLYPSGTNTIPRAHPRIRLFDAETTELSIRSKCLNEANWGMQACEKLQCNFRPLGSAHAWAMASQWATRWWAINLWKKGMSPAKNSRKCSCEFRSDSAAAAAATSRNPVRHVSADDWQKNFWVVKTICTIQSIHDHWTAIAKKRRSWPGRARSDLQLTTPVHVPEVASVIATKHSRKAAGESDANGLLDKY